MRVNRFDPGPSGGARTTEGDDDRRSTGGREYAELTSRLIGTLRLVEADADPAVTAALDVIERNAPLIAAMSGRVKPTPAAAAIRTDVAELRALLAASSTAWRALMEPGRARANGVPAAMLARLRAIEQMLDDRVRG